MIAYVENSAWPETWARDTGPFQSLQPLFGTVCRSTSRLHRLFPPSEAV